MRILFAAVVIAAAGMSGPAGSVEAGNPAEGLAYAMENCTECHAVEADDFDSPVIEAPPFEEVANVPAMSELALLSFFQTSHDLMPNFVVPAGDQQNLIAYIRSLRD